MVWLDASSTVDYFLIPVFRRLENPAGTCPRPDRGNCDTSALVRACLVLVLKFNKHFGIFVLFHKKFSILN
jgi:hypothetical protein